MADNGSPVTEKKNFSIMKRLKRELHLILSNHATTSRIDGSLKRSFRSTVAKLNPNLPSDHGELVKIAQFMDLDIKVLEDEENKKLMESAMADLTAEKNKIERDDKLSEPSVIEKKNDSKSDLTEKKVIFKESPGSKLNQNCPPCSVTNGEWEMIGIDSESDSGNIICLEVEPELRVEQKSDLDNCSKKLKFEDKKEKEDRGDENRDDRFKRPLLNEKPKPVHQSDFSRMDERPKSVHQSVFSRMDKPMASKFKDPYVFPRSYRRQGSRAKSQPIDEYDLLVRITELLEDEHILDDVQEDTRLSCVLEDLSKFCSLLKTGTVKELLCFFVEQRIILLRSQKRE